MNDKLSLQDLVDLLSKKAKITKKDADSFYREFFQLILERILENDSVKIKDFGAFKLVLVDSRESVNVNTGEKIEIPSHYKLSFIPDKTLKELVNKPFSQFQTILLENEVATETSLEDNGFSEDEKLDNDNTDINIEEENTFSDTEELIIASSAPIVSNTTDALSEKEDDSEKNNSEKKSTTPIYPQSFVYTYTTTETSEESDSIIITFPTKDDLIKPIVELTTDPLHIVEHEDITEEGIQSNDNRKESLPFIPSEENLPKSVISDDLELESDFDSEIETEDDIIVPIVDKRNLEIEMQSVFLDEDPERPLFPLGDNNLASDINFVPFDKSTNKKIEDFESNQENIFVEKDVQIDDSNNLADTNAYMSNIIKEHEDAPFHDFNEPTLRSKIRKMLPVILFISVIVGFLTYGLVKMLNKPYEFEANLGKVNLTLADTLPFVDEEETTAVKETDVMLDSMKGLRAKNSDNAGGMIKSDQTASVPTVVKGSATQKQSEIDERNADSISIKRMKTDSKNFVISDRLKFSILNKAEFHLAKYKGSKNETVTVASDSLVKDKNQVDADTKTPMKIKISSSSTPKANYATIEKGTTLRTLATAYYGDPNYWVYIYQANKKNIANPHSVSIGTNLLIPNLSDYGVSDPKDPKAIQTAKNLGGKN